MNDKGKKPIKDLLSDFSLIKWDNKNNDDIINKARKLIWVAYNSCIVVLKHKVYLRNLTIIIEH